MRTQTKKLTTVLSSSLLLSLLALAGCDKPAVPKTEIATASPAAQPVSYVPPTADQLSQMVAPIALFPDKLVGQVLAGATYPQQITAANQWLGQNPSLKGEALQSAENSQPWDVSVKSLITFPSVLGQMASNIQWTTSLGQAYANDPTDVMNAIQVLRSRAEQSGNLKSSQHLRVSSSARAYAPAPQDYVASSPSEPRFYDGPAVIAPPPQTIVIESAEPDVVYVPQYNPAVVYGEPVRVYPGWTAHQPGYATSTLVETGAISFGIGVLVGAAVSHHHGWGWNSWGVNWGAPGADRGDGRSWHRPAVVYNNAPYVSKSVTVVNRVNNVNVTNNTVNNNTVNNNNYNSNVGNKYVANNVNSNNYRVAENRPVAVNAAPSAAPPRGMMSMPHFTSHDAVPGSRPPAVPMQTQHAMQHPPANQFAALPRDGQPRAVPSMAQLRPHSAAQPTPGQPRQLVMRNAAPPTMQTTREVDRSVQAAAVAQTHINPPAHEEAKFVAHTEPGRPAMNREKDAAMRDHPQQENHVVGNAPPAPHGQSPIPNRPAPRHDATLDREQAQAVRQDVLAIHPAHAHPTEPVQAKRVENPAEHSHTPDRHDKHAGQEHHA